MGERDLWDMIVNNDDICFKHILPRLNRNDIKFLYEVNSETRALIKRPSRKYVLKKKFKVKQMSSISTLEIAWENQSFWGDRLNEKIFCMEVAKKNKLELLRWAREEKKCEWDTGTIITVAAKGNMEMLKYCVANECPVDEYACAIAASNGSLECLKYLHETAKAPWDYETAEEAAYSGHLHILEYLVERKFDEYNTRACSCAAIDGHLDCLKYLHETAKAPWGSDAVREAREHNHPECLQYLRDNDCPLPVGWWYDEDGTLFGEATINAAAKDGDLEMVKYCVANQCPMNEYACAYAAENDQLECLKYLHETAKAPWDGSTSEWAARNGHLRILEYLFERGYDEFLWAVTSAATNGHLDCLKFLCDTAQGGWASLDVKEAHKYNHSECLQYLLDNGCPLPEGWRYEDGELHLPEGFMHSDSESE